MKCLCNIRCRLLKYADMFGKELNYIIKGVLKKLLGSVDFFLLHLF